MATHFLETGPNVGLDILHQVADVDRTVGVRQGASDQNLALRTVHIIVFQIRGRKNKNYRIVLQLGLSVAFGGVILVGLCRKSCRMIKPSKIVGKLVFVFV
jgi:hypothetical protein